MSLPVRGVPTTIVTGFLGTGKTTLLLDAFRHRPKGERWAVLVNEFGEVGIDGAVYEGLTVKEIPGGCICCTAGVALRFGLIELLRTQRPHRLFIEPTGLANPASVLDLLRQPGLRAAISPRATIGLVDPRHLSNPTYTSHDAWKAQVALADVLVGTFANQRSPMEQDAFRSFAKDLWPAKLEVVENEGRFSAPWLDLDPYPRAVESRHTSTAQSASWVFPRDDVWDTDRLLEALQAVIRPNPIAPDGLVRLKGIFRTRQRWLLVQATSDTLTTSPILWRRDSRVDAISLGPLNKEALLIALEKAKSSPR